MPKRVLSLRTTLVKILVPYTVVRRQYISMKKEKEDEKEFYNGRMVAAITSSDYPVNDSAVKKRVSIDYLHRGIWNL